MGMNWIVLVPCSVGIPSVGNPCASLAHNFPSEDLSSWWHLASAPVSTLMAVAAVRTCCWA
jgi:hypothetical protein